MKGISSLHMTVVCCYYTDQATTVSTSKSTATNPPQIFLLQILIALCRKKKKAFKKAFLLLIQSHEYHQEITCEIAGKKVRLLNLEYKKGDPIATLLSWKTSFYVCSSFFYAKAHSLCNAETGNIPTYANSSWRFGVSAVQSVCIQCSLRMPNGSRSVHW